MRKIAILTALLCLLGCFSGCMPDEPVETTDGSQTTTAPDVDPGIIQPNITTTAPVPGVTSAENDPLSQILLSSVAMPVIQESFHAEDGTLLLNYIYQNVFLIHQDAAVASSVFLAMVNDMDYSDGLQTALQQAKDAYAAKPQGWNAYRYQVLFDTMRIDQNVISILGEVTSATGETSSMQVSSNYSLVDGKQLSFSDIQHDAYHYYNLLLLIDGKLKESSVADQLFEDYLQTIADNLRTESFSNWFFTESGMTFFFLPYEISSNANGTVMVEIPYSDLTGLLADAYFPAENYITGGALYAQVFDMEKSFSFQNFAEIIQDPAGTEILLYTDGTLSDIRLELGSWNAAGTAFVPTATIFACDGLSSDTAIVVQSKLPEVMPVLRVRYVSEGVEHNQFISQSSADGTIHLTNS